MSTTKELSVLFGHSAGSPRQKDNQRGSDIKADDVLRTMKENRATTAQATMSDDMANSPEKSHSFTASEECGLAGTPHSTPNHRLSLLAYLIVPATFLIWLNTWGAINAFGVFQTHYKLSLLSSYSPSAIAWIGSVQNWLILFVGFLSGPLYDAGYTPYLVSGGTALTVLGKMMLSLCGKGRYWEVFLSQAICVGLGWGLMFTPAASMPGRLWEGKQLRLVTSIASAGASVGGVVYSVTFNQLLQKPDFGFPWATRSLGFLAFATLAFSSIVMSIVGRKRQFTASHRQFVDWTAFKEFQYNAYLAGGIFTMAGVQAPYFYANLYAIDKGMVSTEVGFYVVTAINTGSFSGRLTPHFVVVRIGVFNTFILYHVATFVACFAFIAAHSASSIFVVATLYGFFSGAVVTLSPMTIIQVTPDAKLIGSRIGMAFAIPSFGVLVGCPVFGAILSATNSYTYVWILSGFCLVTGTALMVVCRIAQSGWVFVKKV